MKLYALHDRKSEAFTSFHAEKTDAVASRAFVEAVLRPDSVLGKFPEDFELVRLAELSEDSGLSQDAFFVTGVEGGLSFHVVLTAVQVLAAQPKPTNGGV